MQKPNKQLIFGEFFIAIALLLDAFEVRGLMLNMAYSLAYLGFFAWSIFEIQSGVNPFRKTLGFAGLLLVAVLAWRRFL